MRYWILFFCRWRVSKIRTKSRYTARNLYKSQCRWMSVVGTVARASSSVTAWLFLVRKGSKWIPAFFCSRRRSGLCCVLSLITAYQMGHGEDDFRRNIGWLKIAVVCKGLINQMRWQSIEHTLDCQVLFGPTLPVLCHMSQPKAKTVIWFSTESLLAVVKRQACCYQRVRHRWDIEGKQRWSFFVLTFCISSVTVW